MLLSMTGFGNATQQGELATVSIELKAVNNRYLKLSVRLPDMLNRYESEIEKLIRESIARGSVQLNINVRLSDSDSTHSIDPATLSHYVKQLQSLQQTLEIGTEQSPVLSELLQLPGVISESEPGPEAIDSVWPLLQSTLKDALKQFHVFRRREGESMQQDLSLQCRTIEEHVNKIAEHAPEVVDDYRRKLLERIRKAVAEADVTVSDHDLIRDVAMFADRCDINEELTRLRCHIEQFQNFLNGDRSMGRKLEFVGQEMFREINTIGSKANNVRIAHSVVEMKAAIERIREVLQNVE